MGQGDSVAIFSDIRIEYVLALFAVITAGACTAPLNPQLVVPLAPANLLALVNGVRGVYRLTPRDATLLVRPLSHGEGEADKAQAAQAPAGELSSGYHD